jgi:hypothetical protein
VKEHGFDPQHHQKQKRRRRNEFIGSGRKLSGRA